VHADHVCVCGWVCGERIYIMFSVCLPWTLNILIFFDFRSVVIRLNTRNERNTLYYITDGMVWLVYVCGLRDVV